MTANAFQLVLLACAIGVIAGGAVWSIALPAHITEITGFCSLLALTILKMVMDARISERAAKAAAIVVETTAATVRQAVESRAEVSDKLDTAAGVQEDIHTLVNSNMGVQLEISAAALRRIANLTKDPKDVAVAVRAETLLAEHLAKQRVVDRRP